MANKTKTLKLSTPAVSGRAGCDVIRRTIFDGRPASIFDALRHIALLFHLIIDEKQFHEG